MNSRVSFGFVLMVTTSNPNNITKCFRNEIMHSQIHYQMHKALRGNSPSWLKCNKVKKNWSPLLTIDSLKQPV